MQHKYVSTILGGTFDHFHIGHEAFVSAPFNDSLHVTIGIVESPFSNAKSFALAIESYAVRLQNLTNYLKGIGVFDRSTIIPIHDIYGTTLTGNNIEAIYVTSSTRQNAVLINEKRLTLGMPPLEIKEVPHVKADDGQIVSSSLIRSGIIDRSGHSYLKIFKSTKSLVMPESLRDQLREPLGIVISDYNSLPAHIPGSSLIVTVGDIVSMDLLKTGITPAICVVDFQTKRADIDKRITAKYFPIIHQTLQNPAGSINPQIADIYLQSFNIFQKTSTTQIIKVDGEEDLLTLPALLLSPLGSFVIYGIPNLGACVIEVTPEIKSKIKSFFYNLK